MTKKGNEIEHNTSLAEGSFVSKEVRNYDATGKLIGSVSSTDEGAHERWVYVYEGGKMIRIDSQTRCNGPCGAVRVTAHIEDHRPACF